MQEIEQQIQLKNKEILKFKMAHEDLTQRMRHTPALNSSKKANSHNTHRRACVNDLTSAINSAKLSLSKVRKAILA